MERPGDNSMDSLAAELGKMKVTVDKQKPTGFVYHADMLKHAISMDDEDVAKSHVENPYRLKSIVDRFKNTGVTAMCDTVTEFPECTQDLVDAVHPEAYYDYIDSFWDKNKGDKRKQVRIGII